MRKKKLYNFLNECLGSEVTSIVFNNDHIRSNELYTCVIEEIEIQIGSNTFAIEAVDIPHFFGEGDLDVFKKIPTKKLFPNSFSFKVNEIKVWGYKPKGLNIFANANIVQIEFLESRLRNFSIGFFLIKESDKLKFIVTKEIAFNVNNGLSKMMDGNLILLKSF